MISLTRSKSQDFQNKYKLAVTRVPREDWLRVSELDNSRRSTTFCVSEYVPNKRVQNNQHMSTSRQASGMTEQSSCRDISMHNSLTGNARSVGKSVSERPEVKYNNDNINTRTDAMKTEILLQSAIVLPSTSVKNFKTKRDRITSQSMASKDDEYKNSFQTRFPKKFNKNQTSRIGGVKKLDQQSGNNRLLVTSTRGPEEVPLSCSLKPALYSSQQQCLDRSSGIMSKNTLHLYPVSDTVSALPVMDDTPRDGPKTPSYSISPVWPSYEDMQRLCSCQEHFGLMTQLHRNQTSREYCRQLRDYATYCLSKERMHTTGLQKTAYQLSSSPETECILCNLYSYNSETTPCPPNSPVAPADSFTDNLLGTDTRHYFTENRDDINHTRAFLNSSTEHENAIKVAFPGPDT